MDIQMSRLCDAWNYHNMYVLNIAVNQAGERFVVSWFIVFVVVVYGIHWSNGVQYMTHRKMECWYMQETQHNSPSDVYQ